MGYLLSADPNITDLTQREHLEILAGIGEGHRKKSLSVYKSSNISETRQDRTKVIEFQYRKSYTCVRLVPKSTSLDDLEGSLCILF